MKEKYYRKILRVHAYNYAVSKSIPKYSVDVYLPIFFYGLRIHDTVRSMFLLLFLRSDYIYI